MAEGIPKTRRKLSKLIAKSAENVRPMAKEKLKAALGRINAECPEEPDPWSRYRGRRRWL